MENLKEGNVFSHGYNRGIYTHIMPTEDVSFLLENGFVPHNLGTDLGQYAVLLAIERELGIPTKQFILNHFQGGGDKNSQAGRLFTALMASYCHHAGAHVYKNGGLKKLKGLAFQAILFRLYCFADIRLEDNVEKLNIAYNQGFVVLHTKCGGMDARGWQEWTFIETLEYQDGRLVKVENVEGRSPDFKY